MEEKEFNRNLMPRQTSALTYRQENKRDRCRGAQLETKPAHFNRGRCVFRPTMNLVNELMPCIRDIQEHLVYLESTRTNPNPQKLIIKPKPTSMFSPAQYHKASKLTYDKIIKLNHLLYILQSDCDLWSKLRFVQHMLNDNDKWVSVNGHIKQAINVLTQMHSNATNDGEEVSTRASTSSDSRACLSSLAS